MKRNAEARRCPKCDRKSATRRTTDRNGESTTACRWCDYVRIRFADGTVTSNAKKEVPDADR